jgi:hypothetical protein
MAVAAHIHDPSLADLFDRLAILEARVRRAVERRRAGDPDPDDRFRGLYVSDAQVDQLLGNPTRLDAATTPEIEAASARLNEQAAAALALGEDLRVRRLGAAFGLDEVDLDILLVALAPDLDPRFERLFAYLHDDVSRRRASTGLALELAAGERGLGPERHRLDPSSPLVSGALVLIEDADRPFLTRSLRIPDRVAGHLLGHDRLEPAVAALLADVAPLPAASTEALERTFAADVQLGYVRDRTGAAGRAWALAGLRVLYRQVLCIDLGRLAPNDDVLDLAEMSVREARLSGGALVVGPVEVLMERGPTAVRAFGEAACPVVITGARSWDPSWSRQVPVLLDAPVMTRADRHALWDEWLALEQVNVPVETDLDAAAATSGFRLDPDQVRRAAVAASRIARAEDRSIGPRDVTAGARAQNAGGLERLARRVEAGATWDELILPSPVRVQLDELTSRARHRERVLGEWGMAGSGGRGAGLTALFAGDSGTGKTLSAEVVARDLGLDLYVIDLATVVDKYIGETEKNLDRIFSEADRVNGVLLFDEADAIFGKRSEVKDARDRYANVEIAYLLQRMERFDGLAVLTTNLRANLDDAFLRRLDVIVDFPMPEEEQRLRLWDLHLPPPVPRTDDIDFDFLASAFRLSGGNIRNVCVAATFLAAADDRPVAMADLVRATEREYQKLGRLTHEAEFGSYMDILVDAHPPI